MPQPINVMALPCLPLSFERRLKYYLFLFHGLFGLLTFTWVSLCLGLCSPLPLLFWNHVSCLPVAELPVFVLFLAPVIVCTCSQCVPPVFILPPLSIYTSLCPGQFILSPCHSSLVHCGFPDNLVILAACSCLSCFPCHLVVLFIVFLVFLLIVFIFT